MSTAYGLRPSIHCGPLVDKYLGSEGAIAQAVDERTILLRSSVFNMSVSERRLILLHELAHLEQLARAGSDPAKMRLGRGHRCGAQAGLIAFAVVRSTR